MKNLIMNGFVIIPCGEKHATHSVTNTLKKDSKILMLSQDIELCKKLCTEHDASKQFAADSRFTYTSNLINNFGDFPLGAAACVQMTIWEHYGKGFGYVLITKEK